MRVYIAIAVAFQGCIIPRVCVRGCMQVEERGERRERSYRNTEWFAKV